jgi:hypothetical protein
MISESDLQRATLALKVATNMVLTDGTAKNHQGVIKQSVQITQSELIQGSCLDQLQEFFKVAAKAKIVDKAQANVMLDLVSLKAQQSALCLALLVVGDPTHAGYKQTFVTLAGDKADAHKQIRGALCLGEFGKLVDLSKEAAIFQMLQDYF